MQVLHTLLKKRKDDNSPLAQALYYALKGVRSSMEAALEHALKDNPDDVGIKDCQQLLADLDELLGVNGPAEDSDLTSWLRATGSSDVQANAPPSKLTQIRLNPLRDEILAQKSGLTIELGALKLREDSDAWLWRDVQLLLLRLPADQAVRWRDRARLIAEGVQCQITVHNVARFSFHTEELLFPGLEGAIQAPGLGLSPDAPLEPRVKGIFSEDMENNPELRFLAQAVSVCLGMADLDPNLHHALETVYRFDVVPFQGDQRTRFEQELLNRLQRVCQMPEVSMDALKSRLDLDEAIHSLTHMPPADRTSWWGGFRQRCRDSLFRAANRLRSQGHEVQLRAAPESFRSADELTHNNVPLKVGGATGMVLASLRIWAKLDGRVYPGRVIYRS